MASDQTLDIPESLRPWASKGGRDPAMNDCVRMVLSLVAGPNGFAVLGLPDWYDERSALLAIKSYGGTLAGCVIKACEQLGLGPIRPDKAGEKSVGLASQKSAFGATICIMLEGSWWTLSDERGVCRPEGQIVQAWGHF